MADGTRAMIEAAADGQEDRVDAEELALWRAIMGYRDTLGLPPVPFGLSLTAAV